MHADGGDAEALLEGQIVGGRYRVVSLIGRGGMGRTDLLSTLKPDDLYGLTRVSENAVMGLSSLKGIVTLIVDGIDISPEAIPKLAGFKNLKTLYRSYDGKWTPTDYASMRKVLPHTRFSLPPWRLPAARPFDSPTNCRAIMSSDPRRRIE